MPETENSHLKKLLVVDDEPAIHKLITLQFSKRQYQVISCLRSTEVLDKVVSEKPDLVLMDLMMPELDGISATRRIRNLELESYLPIIVVTARKDVRDVVAALDAGADDYISKPFQFDELHARVRNMLRLKKLQDNLLHKSRELNEASDQILRLNKVLTDTNRQLQKKIYDFHNLFEISFKVMGEVETVKLINTALLNVLGIFAAKSALLLLQDPEDHDLFRAVASKGIMNEEIQNLEILRHDKLIHYLELIKRPFQVSEVVREFRQVVHLLNKLEIRVVAPLFRKEEIFGALCLGQNVKEEEYSPDILELLGIVSNMLSVALNNAHNFEKIKALSYTDGMTGLHNYRFFKLRLREELARARRNESEVSLLILDVDFFKNYNDTLGHPAGDEVLRKLSAILKQTVRDNDIVARYGGEEFAIILPATGSEGAHALGERIREKVEEHYFPREEIQPNGTLTISVGISTFPVDAVVLEDFIIMADQALYHAKATGRNKVVLYSDLKNQVES